MRAAFLSSTRCRGRPESVRVLSAEAPEEDTDEMEAERKLQELLKVLDTARVSPALFLSLCCLCVLRVWLLGRRRPLARRARTG